MKINKLLLMTVLLAFFMSSVNVNAACASGAEVSGEFVCLVDGATAGNSSGTAYPENSVLVLKNYNGGSISFSSGIGEPFGGSTIKLIGDNYINADNGYGILMFNTGVKFIGDGTLTIKSKLPFSVSRSTANLGDTVTEIKIVSGTKLNESNSVVEENKETTDNTTNNNSDVTEDENDNDNDNDSNLVIILLVVCCVISLISLIICVTMLSNKKNNI